MIQDIGPLVTVIVISYNHGKYIRQNLDSIKNQSYKNIELIVADDASKDNSVEIFNLWLTENNYTAKKLFHKTNTGLNTLLNECFPLITGKYVKLIAADDFLHVEYIEECVKKLESLGDSYGMVYTNIIPITDNGDETVYADYDVFWVNKTKETFRQELRCANKIAAVSVMMASKALFETGYYDTNILIEDYDRWLRINEIYWIAYIPRKLAYYRQHENNISKIKKKQIDFETIKLLLTYAQEENKNVINGKMRDYFLSGNKIPREFSKKYSALSYREKMLDYCIKFRLPIKFYKLLRQ